jgi:gamma-glutamyltranspeptidase
MTVADKEGISLIQSNYRGMGSGMVPPKWALCYKIENYLI